MRAPRLIRLLKSEKGVLPSGAGLGGTASGLLPSSRGAEGLVQDTTVRPRANRAAAAAAVHMRRVLATRAAASEEASLATRATTSAFIAAKNGASARLESASPSSRNARQGRKYPPSSRAQA